ncbi:putative Vacuolar protein sorting-associated protein 13C [Blattamonas nauphoetae]|uniref:Vacuolar protein sorting-associated protein 13C n=1 Tax=Blattamonas nauphoetae TaxID=2049346 RepID=A0ABQ9XHX4_9EUKA|nr:putative Vacuolar protein sorting-associated protein 13C [Blattamonas nauphoetae]
MQSAEKQFSLSAGQTQHQQFPPHSHPLRRLLSAPACPQPNARDRWNAATNYIIQSHREHRRVMRGEFLEQRRKDRLKYISIRKLQIRQQLVVSESMDVLDREDQMKQIKRKERHEKKKEEEMNDEKRRMERKKQKEIEKLQKLKEKEIKKAEKLRLKEEKKGGNQASVPVIPFQSPIVIQQPTVEIQHTKSDLPEDDSPEQPPPTTNEQLTLTDFPELSRIERIYKLEDILLWRHLCDQSFIESSNPDDIFLIDITKKKYEEAMNKKGGITLLGLVGDDVIGKRMKNILLQFFGYAERNEKSRRRRKEKKTEKTTEGTVEKDDHGSLSSLPSSASPSNIETDAMDNEGFQLTRHSPSVSELIPPREYSKDVRTVFSFTVSVQSLTFTLLKRRRRFREKCTQLSRPDAFMFSPPINLFLFTPQDTQRQLFAKINELLQNLNSSSILSNPLFSLTVDTISVNALVLEGRDGLFVAPLSDHQYKTTPNDAMLDTESDLDPVQLFTGLLDPALLDDGRSVRDDETMTISSASTEFSDELGSYSSDYRSVSTNSTLNSIITSTSSSSQSVSTVMSFHLYLTVKKLNMFDYTDHQSVPTFLGTSESEDALTLETNVYPFPQKPHHSQPEHFHQFQPSLQSSPIKPRAAFGGLSYQPSISSQSSISDRSTMHPSSVTLRLNSSINLPTALLLNTLPTLVACAPPLERLRVTLESLTTPYSQLDTPSAEEDFLTPFFASLTELPLSVDVSIGYMSIPMVLFSDTVLSELKRAVSESGFPNVRPAPAIKLPPQMNQSAAVVISVDSIKLALNSAQQSMKLPPRLDNVEFRDPLEKQDKRILTVVVDQILLKLVDSLREWVEKEDKIDSTQISDLLKPVSVVLSLTQHSTISSGQASQHGVTTSSPTNLDGSPYPDDSSETDSISSSDSEEPDKFDITRQLVVKDPLSVPYYWPHTTEYPSDSMTSLADIRDHLHNAYSPRFALSITVSDVCLHLSPPAILRVSDALIPFVDSFLSILPDIFRCSVDCGLFPGLFEIEDSVRKKMQITEQTGRLDLSARRILTPFYQPIMHLNLSVPIVSIQIDQVKTSLRKCLTSPSFYSTPPLLSIILSDSSLELALRKADMGLLIRTGRLFVEDRIKPGVGTLLDTLPDLSEQISTQLGLSQSAAQISQPQTCLLTDNLLIGPALRMTQLINETDVFETIDTNNTAILLSICMIWPRAIIEPTPKGTDLSDPFQPLQDAIATNQEYNKVESDHLKTLIKQSEERAYNLDHPTRHVLTLDLRINTLLVDLDHRSYQPLVRSALHIVNSLVPVFFNMKDTVIWVLDTVKPDEVAEESLAQFLSNAFLDEYFFSFDISLGSFSGVLKREDQPAFLIKGKAIYVSLNLNPVKTQLKASLRSIDIFRPPSVSSGPLPFTQLLHFDGPNSDSPALEIDLTWIVKEYVKSVDGFTVLINADIGHTSIFTAAMKPLDDSRYPKLENLDLPSFLSSEQSPVSSDIQHQESVIEEQVDQPDPNPINITFRSGFEVFDREDIQMEMIERMEERDRRKQESTFVSVTAEQLEQTRTKIWTWLESEVGQFTQNAQSLGISLIEQNRRKNTELFTVHTVLTHPSVTPLNDAIKDIFSQLPLCSITLTALTSYLVLFRKAQGGFGDISLQSLSIADARQQPSVSEGITSPEKKSLSYFTQILSLSSPEDREAILTQKSPLLSYNDLFTPYFVSASHPMSVQITLEENNSLNLSAILTSPQIQFNFSVLFDLLSELLSWLNRIINPVVSCAAELLKYKEYVTGTLLSDDEHNFPPLLSLPFDESRTAGNHHSREINPQKTISGVKNPSVSRQDIAGKLFELLSTLKAPTRIDIIVRDMCLHWIEDPALKRSYAVTIASSASASCVFSPPFALEQGKLFTAQHVAFEASAHDLFPAHQTRSFNSVSTTSSHPAQIQSIQQSTLLGAAQTHRPSSSLVESSILQECYSLISASVDLSDLRVMTCRPYTLPLKPEMVERAQKIRQIEQESLNSQTGFERASFPRFRNNLYPLQFYSLENVTNVLPPTSISLKLRLQSAFSVKSDKHKQTFMTECCTKTPFSCLVEPIGRSVDKSNPFSTIKSGTSTGQQQLSSTFHALPHQPYSLSLTSIDVTVQNEVALQLSFTDLRLSVSFINQITNMIELITPSLSSLSEQINRLSFLFSPPNPSPDPSPSPSNHLQQSSREISVPQGVFQPGKVVVYSYNRVTPFSSDLRISNVRPPSTGGGNIDDLPNQNSDFTQDGQLILPQISKIKFITFLSFSFNITKGIIIKYTSNIHRGYSPPVFSAKLDRIKLRLFGSSLTHSQSSPNRTGQENPTSSEELALSQNSHPFSVISPLIVFFRSMFSSLGLPTTGGLFVKYHLDLSSVISFDIFNIRLATFEPLIEPIEIRTTLGPSIIPSLSFQIETNHALNINLSNEMLSTLSAFAYDTLSKLKLVRAFVQIWREKKIEENNSSRSIDQAINGESVSPSRMILSALRDNPTLSSGTHHIENSETLSLQKSLSSFQPQIGLSTSSSLLETQTSFDSAFVVRNHTGMTLLVFKQRKNATVELPSGTDSPILVDKIEAKSVTKPATRSPTPSPQQIHHSDMDDSDSSEIEDEEDPEDDLVSFRFTSAIATMKVGYYSNIHTFDLCKTFSDNINMTLPDPRDPSIQIQTSMHAHCFFEAGRRVLLLASPFCLRNTTSIPFNVAFMIPSNQRQPDKRSDLSLSSSAKSIKPPPDTITVATLPLLPHGWLNVPLNLLHTSVTFQPLRGNRQEGCERCTNWTESSSVRLLSLEEKDSFYTVHQNTRIQFHTNDFSNSDQQSLSSDIRESISEVSTEPIITTDPNILMLSALVTSKQGQALRTSVEFSGRSRMVDPMTKPKQKNLMDTSISRSLQKSMTSQSLLLSQRSVDIDFFSLDGSSPSPMGSETSDTWNDVSTISSFDEDDEEDALNTMDDLNQAEEVVQPIHQQPSQDQVPTLKRMANPSKKEMHVMFLTLTPSFLLTNSLPFTTSVKIDTRAGQERWITRQFDLGSGQQLRLFHIPLFQTTRYNVSVRLPSTSNQKLTSTPQTPSSLSFDSNRLTTQPQFITSNSRLLLFPETRCLSIEPSHKFPATQSSRLSGLRTDSFTFPVPITRQSQQNLTDTKTSDTIILSLARTKSNCITDLTLTTPYWVVNRSPIDIVIYQSRKKENHALVPPTPFLSIKGKNQVKLAKLNTPLSTHLQFSGNDTALPTLFCPFGETKVDESTVVLFFAQARIQLSTQLMTTTTITQSNTPPRPPPTATHQAPFFSTPVLIGKDTPTQFTTVFAKDRALDVSLVIQPISTVSSRSHLVTISPTFFVINRLDNRYLFSRQFVHVGVTPGELRGVRANCHPPNSEPQPFFHSADLKHCKKTFLQQESNGTLTDAQKEARNESRIIQFALSTSENANPDDLVWGTPFKAMKQGVFSMLLSDPTNPTFPLVCNTTIATSNDSKTHRNNGTFFIAISPISLDQVSHWVINRTPFILGIEQKDTADIILNVPKHTQIPFTWPNILKSHKADVYFRSDSTTLKRPPNQPRAQTQSLPEHPPRPITYISQLEQVAFNKPKETTAIFLLSTEDEKDKVSAKVFIRTYHHQHALCVDFSLEPISEMSLGGFFQRPHLAQRPIRLVQPNSSLFLTSHAEYEKITHTRLAHASSITRPSFMTFEFTASIHSIGISLISSGQLSRNPAELLFLSVEGIHANLSEKSDEQNATISIKQLQLDNGSRLALYPVVLNRTANSLINSNGDSCPWDEARSVITAWFTRKMLADRSVVYVSQLGTYISELDIFLEEPFIVNVLKTFSEIDFKTIQRKITKIEKEEKVKEIILRKKHDEKRRNRGENVFILERTQNFDGKGQTPPTNFDLVSISASYSSLPSFTQSPHSPPRHIPFLSSPQIPSLILFPQDETLTFFFEDFGIQPICVQVTVNMNSSLVPSEYEDVTQSAIDYDQKREKNLQKSDNHPASSSTFSESHSSTELSKQVARLGSILHMPFLSTLLTAFGSVDHACLRFKGFLVRHLTIQPSQLAADLSSHFKQELIRNGAKLFGSLGIFGDVTGLVSSFWYDARRIYYDPHIGAEKGIGKGLASAAKHATFGVFDSAGKLTGAASSAVAVLQMDSEYKSQHARSLAVKPKHVGDGLLQGTVAFGKGVAGGVAGVIADPIRGAQRNGAAGFFKGLWTGITGTVVKPVVGTIDFATKALEGINSTQNALDEKVRGRTRLPRFISSTKGITPYNKVEAQGAQYLSLARRNHVSEQYQTHVVLRVTTVRKVHRVLILTNHRLLCVHIDEHGDSRLTIEWEMPLAVVLQVFWTENTNEMVFISAKPGNAQQYNEKKEKSDNIKGISDLIATLNQILGSRAT